jgi:hypothetical protein
MELLSFLHQHFGISRNSLAKLLRKARVAPLQRKTYLRGRKPIYCNLCVLHLKKLWELKLQRISARSIARLLEPHKKSLMKKSHRAPQKELDEEVSSSNKLCFFAI